MAVPRSRRSLIALQARHRPPAPARYGCAFGITGRPAAVSRALQGRARAPGAARAGPAPSRMPQGWRSTPATMRGGRAVVKMKPGAKQRTKSTRAAGPGDIAADQPEGLGEGALDHVDAVGEAVALGDAGAARAIQPDRMHFVEIGEGAEFLRHVAQRGDRRDVAIHGIDRFEGDHLRRARRSDRRHQRAQVRRGSLWRKMCFSARLWRMPSIIEAWLCASENTMAVGQLRAPGRRGWPCSTT